MAARLLIGKIIEMDAFGKARPRLSRRRAFMPKVYRERQKELRLQFGAVPESSGPLVLSVVVVRRMPVSWSKKKRAARDGMPTTTTPDIDNIAGAVMDALFADDSQVVELYCRKEWGGTALIKISIWEVYFDETK